jgi:acetylornithine deacetylase/succinyl-diaminopimelate desuccinylase-like protein
MTISLAPSSDVARIYRRLGIPAVAFGLGLTDEMHGPDEYVPTANLAPAAAIYADVASQLVAARPRA